MNNIEKNRCKFNTEDRIKSIKERETLYNKKYLSEIIELEKPEFLSNNLILSPVGSGKSFLIEKTLIPKGFTGNALYLTSNTALKDSVCPNDNSLRKMLAMNGESVKFFTSSNKNRYGDKLYNVHVMTYREFGVRVKPPHQTFTDKFDVIFCDEIHSLPRYLMYDQNIDLGMALNWLLKKHENKKIFYFTATRDSIDELNKTPGYFDVVKTFDYLDHPNIRRYVSNSTYYINHINQLIPHLKAKLESFNYYGYKALAFTRLKKEQNKIKEIAIREGYEPIVLWSINNEEKMSDEQLRVRNFILNTGNIPEPYNLLIINGAMQEGWNLYDDKVTLAILDTTDITEQTQALGRIRRNIDFVIKKTNNASEIHIEVPECYLDTCLSSIDKDSLCEQLYILDSKGRLTKWPTIKKLLISSGYLVKDSIRVLDNERKRVSTISLEVTNS